MSAPRILAGLVLCLAAFGGPMAHADCSAAKAEDGSVSIENEFVRMAWTAQGTPKEFLYKPAKTEFTGGKSSRLLAWDVKELPNWQATGHALPREVKVARSAAEEAAIEIVGRMPGMVSQPKYDQVTATLTVTVRRGVNAVFGRLNVANRAAEAQTFTARLGIEKYSPGVVWAFYSPDIEGPRVAMDLEPGPFSYPVLSGSVPVACVGGLNEHGVGFAGQFEWRVLDMVEGWCSKSPHATLQWAYRRMEIPPGKAWSTDFVLVCFSGFDEFTTMQGGVIGQLMVGAPTWEKRRAHPHDYPPLGLKPGETAAVSVKLTAISPRKVTLEMGSRRLPAAEMQVEKRVDLDLTPGQAAEAGFPWTPKSEGTHVVAARVLEKGKVTAWMERPFVLGATDQAYFAEMPAEELLGESDIARDIASPPLHEAAVQLDLNAAAIPRKPFGRGFVNGPLSALFVCEPKHDLISFREVYQRMDVTMDHVVVPDAHRTQVREMLRRLDLMNPRVLFLSGYSWQKTQALSLAACVLIRGRVSKGMGLVMLAPLDDLKDPQKPLTQFLKDAVEVTDATIQGETPGKAVPMKLFRLGEGRIAVIRGSGAFGYEACLFSQEPTGLPRGYKYWDYGLSQWIKAIHWAGRHEFDLRVEKLARGGDELGMELARENAGQPLPVEIRWDLFDEWEAKVASGVAGVTLTQPRQRAAVRLPPRLPGGVYVADLSLRDGQGRVLRWASHLFEVKPVVAAAVEFKVKGRFLERGEAAEGAVALRQEKPSARALDVDLEVVDAWERVSRRSTQRVSFTEREHRVPFSFDLWDDCRDDRHTLRVTVRNLDVTLHRTRAEFSLRWRPHLYRDDFAVGMWTSPAWRLFGYVTSLQAKPLGLDYFYGGYDPRQRYFTGPTAFPMGGHNLASDNKTLACTPSLCDEKVIADLQAKFAEQVKRDAAGDVRFWMVQDERSFRGEYDYSEPTLAAFRRWLQERYGSLEALNAAWGTGFGRWEDARPVTMKEFRDKGLDPRRAAVWLDFRLFMSKVWADWTRYARDVVKRVCPDGEVGMAGIFAPSVWSGVDYWQAAQVAKVGARYNGWQEETFRSFDPETRCGQWGGYSPLHPTAANLLHPWRNLFHQGHFVWYYKLYANPGGYAYQGVFNCDGTLHGMYNALVQEHRDIKSGIGRCLLGAQWLDDGLALPYSQPSIYINEFLDLPSGAYAAKGLIEDMGYQQRVVAAAQVEAGELTRPAAGVKVFFLSGLTCLSAREAEAVKAFVQAGGVAVADMLAGIRDDRGNAWPAAGPLDEVFGLNRREASLDRRDREAAFIQDTALGPLSGARATFSVAERGIKLAGGRPWALTADGDPVGVVHTCGKGKAIYLNVDLGAYRRLTGGGAVRPELVSEAKTEDTSAAGNLTALMAAVLRWAGIERPRVIVRSPAAEGPLGENSYWRDGGALYLGFRPTVAVTVPAVWEWDAPGHIYEMRTGRYFGRVSRIEHEAQPGRALVFSRMPYAVRGLEMTCDRTAQTAYRPGDRVRVKVGVATDTAGEPGRHVFRIEVTEPSGREAECYAANVEAAKGRVRVYLPLALNATAGTWQVHARDAATGVSGRLRFEVAE